MLAPGTAGHWLPGRGIVADVRGRLPHYKDDWIQGCNWGVRVFAPATYIFFASALPALAFGQQLAMDTDGVLTVVHVLISTAMAGLVQSLIGGQPLLIIGVAEPIVLIYGFMYSFCVSTPGLGRQLYLAWCGWVCLWTAIMCLLLAVSNACVGINRFTRFSGELFGALIAILFFQVGVKGIVHEFQVAESATAPTAAAADPSSSSTSSSDSALLLVNGLWGLFLACGLLLTSVRVLKAREWLYGRGWLRGLLADYGVPLLVVAWSALSFAVRPAPGVPRRVQTPNTWEVNDNWSVASRMSNVPGPYIAAALLPAAIISVLFYFDHNVSSQLAQQPEFNLTKPAAYHYDFLLLAALTLVCGLLGLPPVNGVLPQAPMHTRSLAHIHKKQHKPSPSEHNAASTAGNVIPLFALVQSPPAPPPAAAATADGQALMNSGSSSSTSAFAAAAAAQHTPDRGVDSACSPDRPVQLLQEEQNGRSSGELRHRHHQLQHHQDSWLEQHENVSSEAHITQQAAPTGAQQQQQQQPHGKNLKEVGSQAQLNVLPDSAAGRMLLQGGDRHQQQHCDGHYLQLEVREQRITNLLQSLLVCVCLGITPAIKLIPTAVLWGYFIFMAVESLTGSQLWERTLLLVTDPKKRIQVLQQEHAAYLQLVPHRVVMWFTVLQLVYLLGVWALTTWAGVAGVAFPLPIMALVPVRQYVLPLLFKRQHLAQLDAAGYEEAPPIADRAQAEQELYAVGALPEAVAPVLPATAGEAAEAAQGPAAHGVDDEAEVLQHEFVGYRLKHHLTAEQLEQQKSL